MNALNSFAIGNLNRPGLRQPVAVSTESSRPQRRERDFGVGYGNSSGYAAPRRYIADSTPQLFRLA